MNHGEHHHSTSCLSGNELNELCCMEYAGAVLQACRRHTISTDAGPVHTFAPSAAEAAALVRAQGKVPGRVTFVDDAHALDQYAVYGCARDVPNPAR